MRRAITIVAACTCLSAAANGADLHVPIEYSTIQAAIDAAKPGDTVIVANGVYTGDGNRDISFGGKAITVRSANGPEHTTINCQGTPEVPYRGFSFENGEGRDSVLDGFRITNGATLPGAIADVFNGAGILVTQQSSPTIRNMVISSSRAGCWGGAVCCSFQSNPLIENCRLVGNYTDDDGGGLFAWAGSSPVVRNTVIANNVSRVTGGGVTTFGGDATFINTTIVGNEAVFGAGVYSNSMTTFVNSIIRGNTGSLDVQGVPTMRYSNVDYAGVGNVDTDAIFVDPDNGDYRLAANSPMIDRGDPAFVAEDGETDAGGDPRVVGPRVDIGAYEFQDAPCPADYNGSGTVDFGDVVNLLAGWGVCSGCPEDLDRDGTVDFADLIGTLGGWGPCP